ncbi:response regulator [Fodinicurvata sp. EGI_FJ10296]|uniref:response regulator n=1 Tax=Fodinicurvata sp. EGI_FJ10296 TaxID=3231908 RepID=UPI0034539656
MADILLVDDESLVRETIAAMLRRQEHAVVSAGDGSEALQKIGEGRFDIVLMDILMPTMEGIETISKIKKDYPNIKILAMSGGGSFGGHNYLDVALKLGAADIIRKPFTSADLRTKIEGLTGNGLGPIANQGDASPGS